MSNVIIPILILGTIGSIMGVFLAFASKKFEVKIDPNVEKIMEILPGMNCGACGFPGCSGYAEAIALEGADITACSPGGSQVVSDIAEIMGSEAAVSSERKIAKVLCQGDITNVKTRYNFDVEIKTCATSMLYFEGDKSCRYSCLGYGDCAKVCPVNAIEVTENNLAIVDKDKCISCEKCVKECPKNVIEMLVETQKIFVCCSSKDKGGEAKKNCSVACIGCGMCKKVCPVEAITVENNLAKISAEKCIKCRLCISKCPTKAILVVKRKSKK